MDEKEFEDLKKIVDKLVRNQRRLIDEVRKLNNEIRQLKRQR